MEKIRGNLIRVYFLKGRREKNILERFNDELET